MSTAGCDIVPIFVEKHTKNDRNGLLPISNKHDAELARWCEFIGAMLSGGFTKRFGLLLHMYNGHLEVEQIRIKRFEQLLMLERLNTDLLAMDEDVLYMFSKV
jgi:hypothetical protein